MPVDDEGREEPRSRLEAQIDLILSGIPDVVDPLEEAEVWPPNWRERGSFDYLYRRRTLLVRDADVDRVIVGQRDEAPLVLATPDQHDNNLRGRFIGFRLPFLHRRLAGEIAFAELSLALVFGLVVRKRRLIGRERRVRLVKLGLVLVALDAK